MNTSPNQEPKRVILLGASIGRHWDIPRLPERVNNHDFVFEYFSGEGFDKSKKLMEVLARQENKPDAVLLKECAAYFPGDSEDYKNSMKKWIADCQRAGVVPVAATVVPVTKVHPLKKFGIDILKLRNPFKLGGPFSRRRQRAILEYNDWIRAYCRANGLIVLDLEQAVRKNEKSRYLASRYAKLDGLHINKRGYQVLDKIVIPTLEKIDWIKTAKPIS